MKLTILTDNLTQRKDLVTEHGLSYYLETGSEKILFDTGQSDAFIHNAEKLNVNLADADYLVLSHGHYDHSGGLSDFLKLNRTAILIMKAQAMLEKFSYKKYIGMPRGLKLPEDRMLFVDSYLKVSQHLYALGKIKVNHPSQTHFDHFFTRKGNTTIPDSFEDELFLALLNEDGICIITACSHHGILNIIETAKTKFGQPVSRIIGGFHLMDSSRESVNELALHLKEENADQIITGHCTSYENYLVLKESCSNINYGYCGNSYTFVTHHKTLKNENSNTLTK